MKHVTAMPSHQCPSILSHKVHKVTNADLCFFSLQPDMSLHCEIADTRLMYRTEFIQSVCKWSWTMDLPLILTFHLFATTIFQLKAFVFSAINKTKIQTGQLNRVSFRFSVSLRLGLFSLLRGILCSLCFNKKNYQYYSRKRHGISMQNERQNTE